MDSLKEDELLAPDNNVKVGHIVCLKFQCQYVLHHRPMHSPQARILVSVYVSTQKNTEVEKSLMVVESTGDVTEPNGDLDDVNTNGMHSNFSETSSGFLPKICPNLCIWCDVIML